MFIIEYATEQEGLFVKTAPTEPINTFYIWNSFFDWQPEFAQIKQTNQYYIANMANAPLIQFSKSNLLTNKFGRIYWSKNLLSNSMEYDLQEFEKFYKQVANWIKRHSAGKTKYAGINTYFLPDAWHKHTIAR
ncbi:hypothetical protein [Hymenobacter sp. DG01]|uniref:hypothetical protein n=1 Tax=Hymenobacter sp. DG01 TaxID=2584940 RepID=UPI00112172AE|nr:hypothetical protein [Hymenobacter sp. DG01]